MDDIDALWFYRLKPSFNEPAPVSKFLLIAFYLMQQRFTLIFCWVSTGRCSTSLDFIWSSFVSYLTGFYGVLMALTGFYRVLLGFTGFRWLGPSALKRLGRLLLGFTRFSCILPYFLQFPFVPQGLTGFETSLL